jgi:hypothetical protein
LPEGARGYEVEVRRLDEVLERRSIDARVRLLKIDVEGHELDVLYGAERTLREHRPAVLLECEPRHLVGHDCVDVFGHLEALAYHGSFFWRGERRELRAFDAAVHQIKGRRPYANNFVFVPEPRGAEQ